MEMWYEQPAGKWDEALPVGNGRLGAMICGRPERETIWLNEDSIWSGKPLNRINPDALKYLPQIRNLIRQGNIAEAEELSLQALAGTPNSERSYESAGELYLEFKNQTGIRKYRRSLDLEKGICFVEYESKNTKYSREILASFPEQVMVVHMKAEGQESLSFSCHFERSHNRTDEVWANGTKAGFFVDGGAGISFFAGIAVDAKEGEVYSIGEHILVDGAKEVTLYIDIETSFREVNFRETCMKRLEKAQKKGWEQCLAEHIRDFSSLSGRMQLMFGTKRQQEAASYPTDKRLNLLKNGKEDPALYALYFQYGRYLLLSSSRGDSLPANLQGIWSNDIIPPWFSDFTVNINTEMNYWMTGPLNLAKMQEPLVNLCKALVKNGQKTARELLNCEGTACFHNTDIWGKTSPATGKAVWAFWPFGEAWLCRNLFDQYLFTEDKEYLKEIMPILEENVRFCLAQLQETDQGLAICPATSPENLFYEDCSVAEYSENTLAIARNLFRDYVKGCEVLGLQNQIMCDVLEALERMVPTAIGSKGQILEWNQEFPEQDVHHRHVSHLYELHPGCGITPQTPELYKAVRKSLELRGDEGTGWSLAWKVLMWARMEDGAHVEKIMKNLFYVVDPMEEMGIRRGGIYPNLFCAHPPFQIDGNLGYSAAVAEILVQSQGEELVLLPALPPSWRNGEATGFIARGNIRVDLKWEGKNVTYTLTPAHDTTLRLRVGKGDVRGYSLRGGVAYEGNGMLS